MDMKVYESCTCCGRPDGGSDVAVMGGESGEGGGVGLEGERRGEGRRRNATCEEKSEETVAAGRDATACCCFCS